MTGQLRKTAGAPPGKIRFFISLFISFVFPGHRGSVRGSFRNAPRGFLSRLRGSTMKVIPVLTACLFLSGISHASPEKIADLIMSKNYDAATAVWHLKHCPDANIDVVRLLVKDHYNVVDAVRASHNYSQANPELVRLMHSRNYDAMSSLKFCARYPDASPVMVRLFLRDNWEICSAIQMAAR